MAATLEVPEAVPHICSLLEEDDWWLRVTAAQTLGRIGSPTAVEREEAEEEDEEDRKNNRRPPSPSPRAQVALRRRSLLVYEGEAYDLRHGIRRRFVDTITRACVNAESARVAAGETVPRGERRVSVVFVIKTNE